MSETTLLQVKNLHTSFYTDSGEVKAVNGISFNLDRGKILGIVGESGSGKSVTAYSLLRILTDTGRVTEGQVLFNGENVLEFSAQKMHTFRGSRISMIFQDPMTSLNPVYTVGNQLREAIRIHTDRTPAQVHERALEMLTLVGVNEPKKRLNQYPHELSGGEVKRVALAARLALRPRVLLLDEPTANLDRDSAELVRPRRALRPWPPGSRPGWSRRRKRSRDRRPAARPPPGATRREYNSYPST